MKDPIYKSKKVMPLIGCEGKEDDGQTIYVSQLLKQFHLDILASLSQYNKVRFILEPNPFKKKDESDFYILIEYRLKFFLLFVLFCAIALLL